jgi:D-alanyl-D-alanine carboxypeptidase/D-alanyl-D-alanine-endopeptidase (penicillin-binding protein 4)
VPGSDRHAAPWSPAVADANVPVPEGKKRRAGRLALVAGIVVVALLGGGFVGLKVLRNTPEPDLAKVPVFATPGAVLEVPASAAPMPTIAGMAAAVAKPLHDPRLGTHVSFQVSDLATGKVLFSQNRLSPTTPASTMKLATASALLGVRGPNYRLTTKVVAGRHPGEVVLIGGGDPTLSAGSDNPNYPEAARISDLADQVKRALGSTKPTKVIIDTSLFSGPTTGPGWDQDDAHSSYATPIYSLTTDAGRKDPNEEGDADRFDNTALAAGQIFAKLLGLPITAVTSGRAPAGATELGSVQSAPLLRIIENMLITSDNVVAEFMARQVAIALNQPASFAGGAAAVIGQLTKMGIPMQGVTIVDGSGLSPYDRLTPAMLGSLLQFAGSDAHPNMHGLFSGLPVAGWSGTLAGRFTTKGTTGARGVFRAKTGTLTGVHALAGTVVDASGRPLVFVLLLDKVAWNLNYGAAMDKLGAAVAACGCTS